MRVNILCATIVLCASLGCSSGSGSSASGAPLAVTTEEPKGTTAAPATAAPNPPAGTSTAASVSGGGIPGPATEDGAKAVIALLQKAPDPAVEAVKLRPGLTELNAVFSDPALSQSISDQMDKMFGKATKKDFPDGEPFVFCAKSEDLKAWKEDVRRHFPGGYERLRDKLKDGVLMCKFKIGGLAFDSLVNLDGKWFMVPKPFRAVKR